MQSVYLLDVSWLMHRGFHARKDAFVFLDGERVFTGHFHGVLTSLRAIKYREPSSKVVLCLDGVPVNRLRLNSAYKSGRIRYDGMSVSCYVDDVVRIACIVPGVYFCGREDLEADDIMFSLSRRFSREGYVCYILSGDNDILQAVGENVYVVRKVRSSHKIELDILNDDYVYKVFGVSPGKLPLYRALVGDISDNLKGVYRLPRSVAARMASMSNCVDDLCMVEGVSKKWLDLVNENMDLVRVNYDMMRLCEYDDLELKRLDVGDEAWDICLKWGVYDMMKKFMEVLSDVKECK